ncbi:NPC intracellular cholesterol transporter 2-like [Vanessa atalanta]|uniref:NPC intracellular cholesterol transporter 2-like n=1 Tax=Vanessa atalanta TaxID=42275 RepID=UPI001FCD4FF1|nr:NPC intracellular cholesterol transporter 2-like [Vanessa atalanta]
MQVFKASERLHTRRSHLLITADVNMFTLSVVVFSFLAFTAATNVQQCSEKSFEGLNDRVQLSPCKKLPCRLKKGTNQNITIHFTPDKDITEVKNQVSADVAGISVPFIGVDGLPICQKLETENGEKASCPLQAGTKYVYKDSFPILEFYPKIETTVQWALKDGENDIICFKVSVKIV